MHVVATSVVGILLHAFGESPVCECLVLVCILLRLQPIFKPVVNHMFVVFWWMKVASTDDPANSVASVQEATCNAD